MRKFLLICLAIYGLVFVGSLANTMHHDEGELSALPAILISEPWSAIFGQMAGDRMGYPEKRNEEIDDDTISPFGMAVIAIAGLPNAIFLGAAAWLVGRKKRQCTGGGALA